MRNYKFTYGYPKFYPDVRDDEGKSLMAIPGDVVAFSTPPDDGCWVLTDETPDTPPAGPEPAPEAPVPVPEPEVTPPAPEPAPEPVAPAVPVPAPEPVTVTPSWPVQATAAQPSPFVFPGFTNPPARA